MLFKSIYYCKTQENIVEIIMQQPKPIVFYKSFLEFDGANMTSILSFDNRSMNRLLSDEFDEHFSAEYPIFYKNKLNKGTIHKPKYFFRNAID